MDTAMEATLGVSGHGPRAELDEEDYYPQGGWDTVFLVALLLLGLPANALMAWLAGSQARHGAGTRLALLLLSLALSDFLFLAAAAFQIVEIQHGGHWPLGTAACRFYYFLWGVSYSSGLLLLAALSLDRCLLALCPRWYPGRRPVRLPLWVCSGVWVLATLVSVPWLVFPEAVAWWYDLVICLDFWDSEELPLRVLEVLGGLLPFLLLLACHLLTQAAACSARCRRRRPPAPRGFARVAGTVLSAYVVLRLPYQLAQLLYLAFLWDLYPGYLLWEALVYSDYLVLLSSCLSPFLCLLASADLRALLRAVLSSFAAALCEERPGSLTPAEPQAQADFGGQAPPEPTAEALPPATPLAQPRADPTAQPRADPTAQPRADPTAQPRADPTAQPRADPTAQPRLDAGAQPGSDSGAQAQLNPTAQPGSDSGAQPGSDSGAQPQLHPTAQPGSDSGAQPGSDSGAQPGSDSGAQAQLNPTAQPGSDSGAQPGADSGAQPQLNPTAQKQADHQAQPQLDSVAPTEGSPEARPPGPAASSAPSPCGEASFAPESRAAPAASEGEAPESRAAPAASEGEAPESRAAPAASEGEAPGSAPPEEGPGAGPT
ncbi:probable G-protein coupled receptor 152 [Pipistrellus kuhlii]|uniref:Probable G-protein coupled receptor 152 n=1 Tax=Pipistrellus kuhlii TaxID=59472 RepID=A0A7J7RZU6_PIPKU|nr:probable G-protein coupled receptor 152 [Pipistrellus kuhlii]KAF6281649.1 G protein-coupled receptor 152 [Pipistrellus kuhlii]